MKYVGSKMRFKKDLVPIMNNIIKKNNIKTFIDLFVGGANIIDAIECENRIGNDISPYLIALLKGVQNGRVPKELTKEEWLDIRANKDKYDDYTIGNGGYLHSYNARFYNGYAGTTQTSGGIRHYHLESIRNLMKQNLNGIIFTCNDYRDMKEIKDTLIYCDIPYENTIKYEIGSFDHEEFWDWARRYSEGNIVLISEQKAPKDFVCIWEKPIKRTMNYEKTMKTTEKLFVHEKLLHKIV